MEVVRSTSWQIITRGNLFVKKREKFCKKSCVGYERCCRNTKITWIIRTLANMYIYLSFTPNIARPLPLLWKMLETWKRGSSLQGSQPKCQEPVKAERGVTGAAVKQITMSEKAKISKSIATKMISTIWSAAHQRQPCCRCRCWRLCALLDFEPPSPRSTSSPSSQARWWPSWSWL